MNAFEIAYVAQLWAAIIKPGCMFVIEAFLNIVIWSCGVRKALGLVYF